MVVAYAAKSKAWLPGMRLPGLGGLPDGKLLSPLFRHQHHHQGEDGSDPRHLGILAFEVARTMCRLVALHRALSDAGVARLRSDAMRSQGVAYLNTPDQGALLRLACAEMLDDLDAAAAAVARLGSRCGGVWPQGFEHVYADLKAGTGDITRLGFPPKDVEKRVKKMERYVASTSALYVAMEGLAELEAGEQRRLGIWKQRAAAGQKDPPFESFQKRISLQRDRVRQLRRESLWTHSFDKVAELLARSVVSIFVRICSVYGSFVFQLPQVVLGRHGRPQFAPHCHSHLCSHHHHANPTAGVYSSGPLERPAVGNVPIRNSGPILRSPARGVPPDAKSWKEQALQPAPNTLGASGLALRYAKVVALLDKLARSPELVGKETREELYWMLPEGMSGAVRAKLRSHRRMDDGGGGPSEALASGWREALVAILGWLAPMAHDTVQWHSERSLEQRELESEPRVLMLQTLIFSDREKAETAIVEILVAFSCVCRYVNGAEDGADC
uniref:DNA integrity scanning protein DisA n=1 Tax=Anthurium amnicola TaxID=1678845 RepID=A0A1D1XUX0_9ARAE